MPNTTPDPARDQAIAYEVISQHYAERVADIRQKLETTVAALQRDLAAAQTAQRVWEHDRQITSAGAFHNPRHPELIAGERMGIELTAGRGALTAAVASISDPDDTEAYDTWQRAQARAGAVTRWMKTNESTQIRQAAQETDAAGW